MPINPTRFMHNAALLLTLSISFSCRPRPIDSFSKADPLSRRILGDAQPYSAIELNEKEMAESVVRRRQEGWRILHDILRPAIVTTADVPNGAKVNSIPLFQTWYDSREFERMVSYLFRCKLSKKERVTYFGEGKKELIPKAIVQSVISDHKKRRLPTAWTEGRFRELLDQLRTSSDLAGLNGVEGTGVALYSPALIAHYLENLPWVIACRTPTSMEAGDSVFAGCFSSAFPKDAVAIKTAFHRADTGASQFDTTASGLREIFQAPVKKGNWSAVKTPVKKFTSDSDLQKIYSVNFNQNGTNFGTYVLTGIHITTKEIPEWMWVSAWWSNTPESDFGSDRPSAFVKGIDPRFANYKMCVTSTFTERDPRVSGSQQDNSIPVGTLQALRAAYDATKPSTWCSNPFIEHMAQGARSNCIGCHQFASPQGMPQTDETHPPTLQQKVNRFTGDFLASFGNGIRDDFQNMARSAINEAQSEGDQLNMEDCDLGVNVDTSTVPKTVEAHHFSPPNS